MKSLQHFNAHILEARMRLITANSKVLLMHMVWMVWKSVVKSKFATNV